MLLSVLGRAHYYADLTMVAHRHRRKIGKRLRTVAKADKYSSLRDKAGYKRKH